MRLVFVGAPTMAVMTAAALVEAGHEVIIIERDRERITELENSLDAAFLHGDGSKPVILKEANPATTDILFCVTDNDQTNIIASLLAKSLGYRRTVTVIKDVDFEPLCHELRLEHTLVPERAISHRLLDLVAGHGFSRLTDFIKYDARLLIFQIEDSEPQSIAELHLSKSARVIGLYRNQELLFCSGDTILKKGDEILLITRLAAEEKLRERFGNDSD